MRNSLQTIPLQSLLLFEKLYSKACIILSTWPVCTLLTLLLLKKSLWLRILPFLEAERFGQKLPNPPPRLVQVRFYVDNATQFREGRVDLTMRKLITVENLDGQHAYVDAGKMKKSEKACMADPRVQAAIKAFQLPEGAVVVCDPWTYSPDGMNDMSRRCIMCFFYMKLSEHEDANHYAFPLEFVAELSDELKVMQVLKAPSAAHEKMTAITETNLRPFDRSKLPHYSQMLLAHSSSYHSIRSEFGDYPIWVTRHHDKELFAAGDHTLQSVTGSGVKSWIKSRESPESVRNEDLVLWHTFGTTHNPRAENWPVMPVEKMMVSLKPVNFSRNPALDVPISNQTDNKSVLVEDENEKSCCSTSSRLKTCERP